MILRGDEETSAPLSNLTFNSSVSLFDEDTMLISFAFDLPLQVSRGLKPDILQITIIDPNLIVDKENGLAADPQKVITYEIPKQLPVGLASLLEATGTAIVSATTSLAVGQILITILLASSLRSMWNFMNVMQIVVYTRLACAYPANAEMMIGYLDDALTMKPIMEPVLNYFQGSF